MFQKGHTYIVSSGQTKQKFLIAILLASLLAGIPVLAIDVAKVQAVGNGIERISIAWDGSQAMGDESSISDTGRYIAFSSRSDNLIPNVPNVGGHIFVRDRQTDTIVLASASDNGTPGNDVSVFPAISGDGRYVAFRSSANNLVPNDTNGFPDIFVHDMVTQITTRVNISDNGTQSNSYSHYVSINDDGRYVAFSSTAILITHDTNCRGDIFVRDRQQNITSLVSVASDGSLANGDSFWNSISDDGRYVVFYSEASNLVPNDTNSRSDIFVRDLQTLTTTRVSVASDGSQGNGRVDAPLSVSSDGHFIAFGSWSNNLVPNDNNHAPDIFVYDQQTHATNMVSIKNNGTQGNSGSYSPSISDNGSYITFVSSADNLYSADTNEQPDIFIHNRQSNSTAIVSISYDGTPANNISGTSGPGISGNGDYITFVSDASNLVPNDTNGSTDVFVATNPLYEELPPNIPPPPPTPIPTLPSPHVSPALPPQLNQAQISLQYLSVNPQQARVNQPLTISGNVVNTGDQAGNYNLSLKINGQVEQTRMVSVGPQASQPVKFTISKSQPGTYTVDIGGQRETFTVLGKSPGKSSTSNNNLIILAAMGMLALVAVVLFVSRRTS